MSTPAVTVYITNHNYGRFIAQAIESVLSQTFQDFELIIIDDGSTDHSRSIIERYEPHPKVRIIYQQKRGLNRTNNIALRAARGRYLMRLDADDYLDPHALALLSSALDKDPQLGLVFPDYYLVDVEGRVTGLERRHDFSRDVSVFDQPAHGACTMIRREYLLAVGGYDEQFTCQDGYDLWIKFCSRYKVANINLPLFYYRQHGSSLTRNENRILETRAAIKRAHVRRRRVKLSAAAILAIRGASDDGFSVAMESLGEGRRVVDWSIEAALAAKLIRRVVITSSDAEVLAYLRRRYGRRRRVSIIPRPPELARLNVDLDATVRFLLRHSAQPLRGIEVCTLMSCEYPFVASRQVDESVDTMELFNVNAVVSVRPETGMFYTHDGSGLKPLAQRDRLTRLEREAWYRYAGGLTAYRIGVLRKGLRGAQLRRSHIVVEPQAALGLHSAFDLALARAWVKSGMVVQPSA